MDSRRKRDLTKRSTQDRIDNPKYLSANMGKRSGSRADPRGQFLQCPWLDQIIRTAGLKGLGYQRKWPACEDGPAPRRMALPDKSGSGDDESRKTDWLIQARQAGGKRKGGKTVVFPPGNCLKKVSFFTKKENIHTSCLSAGFRGSVSHHFSLQFLEQKIPAGARRLEFGEFLLQ